MQIRLNIEKLTMVLLLAVLFVVLFNTFQISQFKSSGKIQITTEVAKEIKPTINIEGIDIIPKGTPLIYGKELGVTYDDVSSANPQKAELAIKKLGILDQQISLSGEDLGRYIAIASQISCEYCCGVEAIIFSDGKPACGCAHSFAMRGLAKYLIKYHGNKYSNDEILEELGKWKTLFFPMQLTKKAQILKDKGIELNYINIASNKYGNVENQVTGNAVKSVEQIDMSDWTDDEKMQYEHHGILPARLQQGQKQQAMVGGC